jgi:MFS family permease
MNIGPNIARHFPALRFKHFRAFFVAQFISLIGTWMQSTTIPYLVNLKTDGNKFMLGLVSALSTLPILLFTLFAGVIADKHSKKRIVILTQTLMLLQAVGFVVLSALHMLDVGHIIMLGMIGGFLLAFDMPTRQAFIREIVDLESLPSAIAINSGTFNAARTLGPAFAAVVLAAINPTTCFAVNAVSFLGIIVVLMWMRPAPLARPAGPGVSHMKNMHDGLKYASRSRGIRSVLTLIATCSLFGWTYVTILPAIPKDFYSITDKAQQGSHFGLLVSASGVGAVIGALAVAVLSRRGLFLPKLILSGWFIFIATLVGLAFSSAYWVGLVMMFGIGLGLTLLHTASNSLVQTLVPDDYRGRIMGVYTFLFIGLAPFGNFFVGSVAQIANSRVALLINAAVCLTAVLILSAQILAAKQPQHGLLSEPQQR